ncbi:MAG: hypothetical protein ACPGUV_00395 [Polyangiales bacterium]
MLYLPDVALQCAQRQIQMPPGRWRQQPVVLFQAEARDAGVWACNMAARQKGLTHGMRLGAVRARCPEARVHALAPATVHTAMQQLQARLETFSPRVEVSRVEPGLLCLDPLGLEALFGSQQAWAKKVLAALRRLGWRGALALGFHRERAAALARAKRQGWSLLRSRTEEWQALESLPLASLALPPAATAALDELGLKTVGGWLALSGAELQRRFGTEVAARHAALQSAQALPVQAPPPCPAFSVELEVEPPDDDRIRLLFGIKHAIHRLLTMLARHGQALTVLHLELSGEQGGVYSERLACAAPCMDGLTVLELVRLRLQQRSLAERVTRIRLRAQAEPGKAEQLHLRFPQAATKGAGSGPERRATALTGARARTLVQTEAAFKAGAVVQAQLTDGHLPEARFVYTPTADTAPAGPTPMRLLRGYRPRSRLCPSSASDAPPPHLVRRLLRKPQPLARVPHGRSRRGLPCLAGNAPPVRLFGPYRIDGGWWQRWLRRDYYYAQGLRGELFWVFFAPHKRQWFLHGFVD